MHLLQPTRSDLPETDWNILPAKYTETWSLTIKHCKLCLLVFNEESPYQEKLTSKLSTFLPLRLLSLFNLTSFVLLQVRKQLNFNMKHQLSVLSFTTSNYCSGKESKIYTKHNSNSPWSSHWFLPIDSIIFTNIFETKHEKVKNTITWLFGVLTKDIMELLDTTSDLAH